MRIDIVTVFPEMIEQGVSHSIIKRAREAGALDLRVRNLRDYAHDRHRKTDDSPYGGGVGMVMKIEPLAEAVGSIRAEQPDLAPVTVLMTPQGQRLNQRLVEELASFDSLIILCGHYEGIDERVREHLVDREVSIGDYVLTGGELPALILADAVARLRPGVLGKDESSQEESFAAGLLEYPHYTRPEVFGEWTTPDVLMSGHHAEIAKWRRKESLRRTLERRPDLLQDADLDKEDVKFLESLGASGDILAALVRKQK